MGKVTWKGWVTDPEEIAKANAAVTGPLTLRDGRKVITMTIPAPAAAPGKPARRKPAAKR